MRDLKRYWREVREMERLLPPYVWLMTVEDRVHGQPAGLMVEARAEYAAKLIHAGTHRVASAEEIAQHQAKQSDKERQEFHEGLRRRGITIIPVPSAGGSAASRLGRRSVR